MAKEGDREAASSQVAKKHIISNLWTDTAGMGAEMGEQP